MPITQKFIEARAAEQQARVRTHLPSPPIMRLPCRRPAPGFWAGVWAWLTRRPHVVYVPIVHLTERHRAELMAHGNAFLVGLAPLIGDVQSLLWRLHPHFFRPDGEMPNQRIPGGPKYFANKHLIRRARREREAFARLTRHIDLFEAQRLINAYLEATAQDMTTPHDPSATPRTTRRGRACAEPNYFDDFIEACERVFGFSLDEALDTPRALIRQRMRARILQLPEGHILVPPTPSDEFLK